MGRMNREYAIERQHRGGKLGVGYIAAVFRQTPRAIDLQDRFGMSRATAYRFRRALKNLRGER